MDDIVYNRCMMLLVMMAESEILLNTHLFHSHRFSHTFFFKTLPESTSHTPNLNLSSHTSPPQTIHTHPASHLHPHPHPYPLRSCNRLSFLASWTRLFGVLMAFNMCAAGKKEGVSYGALYSPQRS